MNPRDEDIQLEERIRSLTGPPPELSAPNLKRSFAARLKEVASRPDVVPIRLDGKQIDVPLGGTILGAALKNGVRLMHVCGARTLCATCRIKVADGAENLTPMKPAERFSLRWHLSVSSRIRLACQARVTGPVEVETVFPLCGDLPNR